MLPFSPEYFVFQSANLKHKVSSSEKCNFAFFKVKNTRLSVFESRSMRKMFGCKTDNVTGGWRKLCDEFS
jgi:CII-binding regulator of phage lambda lysogenization HflD